MVRGGLFEQGGGVGVVAVLCEAAQGGGGLRAGVVLWVQVKALAAGLASNGGGDAVAA